MHYFQGSREHRPPTPGGGGGGGGGASGVYNVDLPIMLESKWQVFKERKRKVLELRGSMFNPRWRRG